MTRSRPYSAVLSITPLIRAETGEGAAGCASGSHTCIGTRPAFAPNPNSARRKAIAAQTRLELRAAHGIEGELPTAALQDAEAQQDRNCADVRDEQIKKARAANFRECDAASSPGNRTTAPSSPRPA